VHELCVRIDNYQNLQDRTHVEQDRNLTEILRGTDESQEMQ